MSFYVYFYFFFAHFSRVHTNLVLIPFISLSIITWNRKKTWRKDLIMRNVEMEPIKSCSVMFMNFKLAFLRNFSANSLFEYSSLGDILNVTLNFSLIEREGEKKKTLRMLI